MLAVCPPVRGHEAFESPFLSKDSGQYVTVFGCLYTVYDIVGAHDRIRVSFLNNDFELFQIDLAEGPLGNSGIGSLTVGFFVVAAEMLHGGPYMIALDSPHHGGSHPACDHRILGIIFKVPAAQRTSVNVDGRRKPDVDVVLFQFHSAGTTHFV